MKKNIALATFLVFLFIQATSVNAALVNAFVTTPQSVPVFSQPALIGLAIVIGLLGAKLINRFKK